MKPLEYYSTPEITFPRKEDFTVVYVYKTGRVILQCAAHEWPDIKGNYIGYTVEHELDKLAFNVAKQTYANRFALLTDEFKRDLFEEHGVTGHPKAELAFKLAWDYGHSSGLNEVVSYFEELVDLIK